VRARGDAVSFSTIGIDTPTGEDVNGNVEVMSMDLAKMMVEWCLWGRAFVASCELLLLLIAALRPVALLCRCCC
jgi:hypothetical protein